MYDDGYEEPQKRFQWRWIPVISIFLICLFTIPALYLSSRSGANHGFSTETPQPLAIPSIELPSKVTPVAATATAVRLPVNPSPTEQRVFSDEKGNRAVLDPNARLLGETSLSRLVSISRDGGQYVFDNPGWDVTSLSAGNVILGGISPQTPGGFLRRVERVAHSGTTWTVTTSSATLEDAFSELNVAFTYQLSPNDVQQITLADGVKFAQGQPAFKNAKQDMLANLSPSQGIYPFCFEVDTLIDSESGSYRELDAGENETGAKLSQRQILIEGTLEIEPIVRFVIKMPDENNLQTEMGVEFQQKLDLDISANAALFSRSLRIPIAEFDALMPANVGLLPFPITVPVTLYVGLDGSLFGTVSTEIAGMHTLSWGVKTKDGLQWDRFQDGKFALGAYSPPDFSATLEFAAGIGLEVSIRAYNIIGPYGGIEAYFLWQAGSSQDPPWTISRVIEISVGLEAVLQIPFFQRMTLLRADFPLFSNRVVLAQGPKRATSAPSPTALILVTPDYEPLPSEYQCPDKQKVKLRVGMRAKVFRLDVNLRSDPRVPQDWKANIITALTANEKVKVIDGPVCAHDGTWWYVKTEYGNGWMRELDPYHVFLIPID